MKHKPIDYLANCFPDPQALKNMEKAVKDREERPEYYLEMERRAFDIWQNIRREAGHIDDLVRP